MASKTELVALPDSILPKNKKEKFKKNKYVEPYEDTHIYHSELLNKLEPKMFLSQPRDDNSGLLSANYLDDRRHCSIGEGEFGEISGCAYNMKNMFNNPKPDLMSRISNDSFTSRLFKEHYRSLDERAIENRKNEIQNRRNRLPYKTVPGLEIKKGLLEKLDGMNDLEEKDLYQKYCRKKYKEYFPNKVKPN